MPSLRTLIIDDEEFVRLVVSQALREEGARCRQPRAANRALTA